MGSTKSMAIAAVAACVALGLAGMVYVVASVPKGHALDPRHVDLSALDEVPPKAWERLRAKRIYFGHQSVGSNVVEGIEWILERRPEFGLRVVSASDAGAFVSPGLIHGPIGVNGDVGSKLDDFSSVVRGQNGEALDIVLMKFCYADVVGPGDPSGLLKDYRKMVHALATERPSLHVLHSTVPLTWVPTGPKALVKRALGRRPEKDNVVRGIYNDALRASFGADQIFDIAAIEARAPGGEPVWFEENGKAWPTLAPQLTDDGGHLNPGGQVLVARELLLLLVRQAAGSEN